jgi:hypothetical protein
VSYTENACRRIPNVTREAALVRSGADAARAVGVHRRHVYRAVDRVDSAGGEIGDSLRSNGGGERVLPSLGHLRRIRSGRGEQRDPRGRASLDRRRRVCLVADKQGVRVVVITLEPRGWELALNVVRVTRVSALAMGVGENRESQGRRKK